MCILKRLLLIIMLTLSGHAYAQTPSSCKALVIFQNDLWFVKQDGTPFSRLTRDGNMKDAAALSPDEKTIAYVGWSSDSDQKVTLIDANGGYLANVNVDAPSLILEVSWVASNLLRVVEHLNPHNAIFHFVKIPSAISHATVFKELPTGWGTSCTPSPKHKHIACIQGGVYINDQDIYTLSDAFASATVLQNITLSGASLATTLTDPPYKLEVIEISGDRVGLKITDPDDFSQLQYVSPGNTMSSDVALNHDGVALDDNGVAAPVYGFSPTITDKKRRIVNVRVLKSKTGNYFLEGEVAWDRRGRRIVVVEANALGQRSLVLISLQHSDGDADSKENKPGHVDARIPLPIAGPVNAIKFTSDTHIRVTGTTQVYDQDFPANGSIPAGTISHASALPTELAVISGTESEAVPVPVQGWSCR